MVHCFFKRKSVIAFGPMDPHGRQRVNKMFNRYLRTPNKKRSYPPTASNKNKSDKSCMKPLYFSRFGFCLLQAHPKYTFKYGVNDYHTGDVKSQQESRDGDAVKGRYSLVEPDGSIRTVEYSADKHSGFNAVVHKTKPIKHYENEQANEKATGGQQLLTEHSHAHY